VEYLDFAGTNVLVVGGSSGIGNAIARAFRQAGAEVHVWGTRGSAADYDGEPGSDLDGLDYHPVDVGAAGAVEAWAPPFDRLDVLVLSQGITLGRDELTGAGFRRVLEINLVSLMACAIKFHPMLASSAGSLIVIGSSAAFHATPDVPAYNASKSGALGLTRSLARAWAGDGIRVNGIAPGFIPTRLNEAMMADPRRREAALGRIPLGRFGTAEEMAGIALFLASPMASYVVGQTILADGGMLL
jgi:3-oxoacyl-[acyl-carrier protein] reductase